MNTINTRKNVGNAGIQSIGSALPEPEMGCIEGRSLLLEICLWCR